IVALLVLAVAFEGVAVTREVLWTSENSEQQRKRCETASAAMALFALLVFVITVALPGLMYVCAPVTSPTEPRHPAAVIGGAAGVVALQFVAALVAMMRKGQQDSGGGSGSGLLGSVRKMLPPGVLQLMLVLLTLTVLLVAWLLCLGGV